MKKPQEQYVRFPRQLLDSPVLEVLNPNEWRAFLRVLREHQRKSGYVNDGLAVTKADFVRAGVNNKYVASTMRALCALGLFECTRNMGGSLKGRTPNLWRPTFLSRTPTSNDATHEYAKHTLEEAKAIAYEHRQHDTRNRRPPRKRKLRLVMQV